MREEGWRAQFDQRASLFIGRGGAAALGAGRRWSRRSRAAKGQVMGSERGRHQGEADERRGEAGEDEAGRHRHRSLQYGGGQSSSVTTATGRARSGERVHWVPDVEVSVQVQGEVKASAESTGRGDVLARSGASWRASMPILAGAGRVWARMAWAVLTSPGVRVGMVVVSKVRASSET
jgi:hypothetical protein